MTTTQEEVTVEGLSAELESLKEEMEQLRRQRLDERQQIIEIARRAANDNGMCEVVDRALTRAGLLGGEQVTVQATVPIQIVMYADTGSDITAVQTLINGQAAQVGRQVISGLGHLKAVAYGNPQAQDAVLTLNGDITVQSVAPGAPRAAATRTPWRPGRNAADTHNNWANPPREHLALYTTPQGRVVHFVRAVDRGHASFTISDGSIEWYVMRRPLCNPSRPVYGFQFESPRAEHIGNIMGICQDCRDRANIQYQWRMR